MRKRPKNCLDGIAKLYQHNSEHQELNDYIALIKSFNDAQQLAFSHSALQKLPSTFYVAKTRAGFLNYIRDIRVDCKKT